MSQFRLSLIGAALVLAFGAAGCDQRSDTQTGAAPDAPPADSAANAPADPTPANPDADATADAGGASPSGAKTAELSETDRTFVTQAANSGMTEVEASRVAADKATDPQVKSFAKELVADHSKVNAQLMQIAESKGVQLPAEPQGEARDKLDNLRGLSGQVLARTYITDLVDGHKKTIALYERQAQEGTDPELKAFAEKTLPGLREHLAMAEGLASKVN